MKHKFLSLFIAIVAMAILYSPTFASVTINGIAYQLNGTTATVVSGGNYTGTIVIPSSVEYNSATYSVTRISSEAFSGCTGLTSVTIPNSVTSIGYLAFQNCTGLTSVTLPNSIQSTLFGIFRGCSSLTSIDIPEGVTGFDFSGAFSGCSSLTSIVIPNSIKSSIDQYAFRECTSLTSVIIGDSVPSIAKQAFIRCYSLTNIVIGKRVADINSRAFEECTNLQTVTLKSSALVSEDYYANTYLISPALAQVKSYIISDNITKIGNYAFSGCTGMISVTIPNSVTSIGEYAFYGCSGLASVTIPNSVTSIGEMAFYGCSGLASMVVEGGNTKYNSRNNCNAIIETATNTLITGCKNTVIPNGVTSIGSRAFRGCSGLASVTIPNSVTSIGEYAFYGCSGLASLDIPNSVTSIGGYAFDYCIGLTYVTIGAQNPPTLGPNSFPNNIQSIYVPCGSLDIYKANWSSYASKIYNAPFPYTITTNAENGKVSTTSTTSYTICDESAMITCTATPNNGYHFTQWSDGNTDNPRTIVIVKDTLLVAEFAINQYAISVTCDETCGHIEGENGTFDYQTKLTYEAIANYGYHFARWNDYNTTNPRTITITKDYDLEAIFAKNTYSITKNADAEQGSISGLTTAEYLDNVILSAEPKYGYHFTQWGDGNTNNPRTFILTQDTTFTAEFAIDKSGTCGKDNLLQWTFADDGTLTINGSGELTENYTFGVEAPMQMQQLVVGNEVTAIGERAFYEKTTLQKLIIGSNVTSIGKYAFASINNRQLTSLVMPAELLTIGDYAFSGNTYIESIDFNAKLQSIGAYAFKDCYRVSEMTCLATVTPDLGTDALASINSYASLCVPAESLRKYQVDPNWGRFDLCELGTTSTVTENRTVTVEPSDNTAIFTWPTENNAASYSLQITKDGVVFCTLVFNSNGQLTGIAFAPGRNGAAHAPAATMSVAGMSFTVTGLDGASKYAYRIAVTNDASEELVAYSGEFATTGYDGEVNPGGNPEGIEDVFTDEHKASKILHNGQIFIFRGDKTYTLTGAEVK